MIAQPNSILPRHRDRILVWAGATPRLGVYVNARPIGRVEFPDKHWVPWARVDGWVLVPSDPPLLDARQCVVCRDTTNATCGDCKDRLCDRLACRCSHECKGDSK